MRASGGVGESGGVAVLEKHWGGRGCGAQGASRGLGRVGASEGVGAIRGVRGIRGYWGGRWTGRLATLDPSRGSQHSHWHRFREC